MEACPIWKTLAQMGDPTGGGVTVDSPRAGGRYFVSGTAATILASHDKHVKAHLTTWLIDERSSGAQCPVIKDDNVLEAKKKLPLSVRERADRLLKCILESSLIIGISIDYSSSSAKSEPNVWRMMAWAECTVKSELIFLLEYLEKQGWVNRHRKNKDDGTVILSVDGYAHLSDLEERVIDSSQVFVAMWFDKATEDAWTDGIEPAINDVGYRPLRVDQIEHANKIDDLIIAEIRRSRFVVADFTHGDTGPRGGVYYEAGFAYGLGIPVIYTCRRDAFDDVHFDTRQFNHIVWDTPDELRQKLAVRIAAVIGDGPLKHSKAE